MMKNKTHLNEHFYIEIKELLETEYGEPSPNAPPLGNLLDPLDELIFIMLTTMTEFGATKVFLELKRCYPSWEDILSAPKEKFLSILQPLGLVNQRGDRIIKIIDLIKDRFGAVTLQPLNDLGDEGAEEFLLSLPGVGKKVARCVLMYSLGRQVFPVDTHVLRVCRRLEIIPDEVSWQKSHDMLQKAIPPKARYSLHVNLVVHGRETCTSSNPHCYPCVLNHLCPYYAVQK